MKRRDFLKGLAVILATPVVAQLDQFTKFGAVAQEFAEEHLGFLHIGHGIEVKEMGIITTLTRDGSAYKALRYNLTKRFPGDEDLQAYCDIDVVLLDFVGDKDKQGFIMSELQCFVEAMLQEEKARYGRIRG